MPCIKKRPWYLAEEVDYLIDAEDVAGFFEKKRTELLAWIQADSSRSRSCLLDEIAHEGMSLLRSMKTSRFEDDPISENRNQSQVQAIIRQVKTIQNLRVLLADLMKSLVATRNPEVSAYLAKTLVRLAALHTKKHGTQRGLVHRLHSLNAKSASLIHEIHELLCTQLSKILADIYQPYMFDFCSLSKKRVLGVEAPVGLRRGFALLADTIRMHRDLENARKKFAWLIEAHRSKTPARNLQRIQNIADSYIGKVCAFDEFVERSFDQNRIATYHRLYYHGPEVHDITVERVTRRETLTLYPCKDYHEYLKGHYSKDCTAGHDLAGSHLLNPRFANLRIFRDDRWIGNIYLLDYTTQNNTLVIDRIQIRPTKELLLMDFFPKFMRSLIDHLSGGQDIRILGPGTISNFAGVQSGYSRFRRGKRRVRFIARTKDVTFESSRREFLYVLSDGGG
jgi:hypothetical protein